MTWKKFSGENLNLSILEEVEQTIEREYNLGNKLKVCIGTDSQVKGAVTDFATVIVFLREKKGGFMFIHQERTSQKMSIKERMLAEVQKSIECAYSLCDLLDLYEVDLEVHADINTNPNFKSNAALHEAMGYILSMGFVFKAKPEAFASSYCANKMVQ
ncbi:MAG: ribonuclease H-like YkuK family protein [Bacteroidetes bacterium]|nr:ribonuclease H-like YkuK family protein [Bacteroidota bacterium]MBU1372594.1 ribonuclease H-like YkuK family protein [Bacteroidota bacterium]MBU1484790.1 ribonuclease H-like YkuK family protein [Bacteroidota bacterium]MBU1762078.1 ribonuclease H-like YkuK family protein [Bacteroidota bacterium]MBU2267722.1 ribonuclease H-like YkuK family protein [Bacteroidota bacterium]